MPTVKQLKAEAKAMGLHGYSMLNKEELIHKIDKAKGKMVIRTPKPKPRTPKPTPKPRRKAPKPPTRIGSLLPPSYELPPPYESIKDDRPPNFYEDIVMVRAIIIYTFPDEYKGNAGKFYNDWDKIISKKKNMTEQDKKLASSLRRDGMWTEARKSVFAYMYLGPIYQRSPITMKAPMLYRAIFLLFDDLFRGKVPRRPDELAQEFSAIIRMNAAEQKDLQIRFRKNVLEVLPKFKRLLGINIVPPSSRFEIPHIHKNYASENAKGEIVLKKKFSQAEMRW